MKAAVWEFMSVCFHVFLKLSSPRSSFFSVQPNLPQAPRPLMMPLASGSSIFKQSGEQRAVFSRLPAHVVQIFITFLQGLGFPMALFYSTMEIGTSFVLFWGCQLLIYFCHDRKGRPSVLPWIKFTKARSHTVPWKVLKLCLEGFRTLGRESHGVAEASTYFLTS